MKDTVRPLLQTALLTTTKPHAWIPGLAFLVALLAIGTTGFLLYERQVHEIERTAQDQLAAIADLKVGQIVRWLGDQRKDAEAISRDNLLVDEVEHWFQQGAPEGVMAQKILARLASLRQVNQYESIVLLDGKSRLRLMVEDQKFDSHDMDIVLQAIRGNVVTRSDIHWSPAHKPEIDFVVPLAVPGTLGTRVIGAIYFHIDPNVFFFPYIQSWPTKSPSGETLLVRRDGNDVLYLNELRHRKSTALELRLPIDLPLLPAAIALRGRLGVTEGVDYRGVPVLADTRKVPGTSWILVAKLDREEVNASFRGLAAKSGGLVALFMLLTGAVAALWWRKQHAQFLAALYEVQLQRQALAQHFDYATKLARDVILFLDETGRLVECNEAALAAYGYTRDELLKLTLSELRAAQAVAAIHGDLERAARVGGVTFETVHRRKDGSALPVEVSMRRVEIEGRQFYQSIVRDITERKQAEEILHLQSSALHAAVNAIMIADKDGNIQWVNQAFTLLTGYSPEEAIGKNPRQLIKSGKHDQTFYKKLWNTILSGNIWCGETINRRKDGSLYTEDQTISPVRNDRGEITHFIAIKQDITERKRIEETLRESSEKLRALFEFSPLAIIAVAPTDKVLMWNSASERLFGWRAEEVVGGPLPIVPPEGREEYLRALAGADTEPGAELRRFRKDGSMLYVARWTAKLHGAGSELACVVGMFIDVTARKRAEEALVASELRNRHLLNSSPSVIYATSITPPHHCSFISDTLTRMTGYAPQMMLDDPGFWRSRVHPEDLKQIKSEIKRLLADGEGTLEYRFCCQDGEYHWIRDAFRVIYDSNDRRNEMVGAWTDITTSRHMEQQLAQAQKMEAVGQLTGGVAHDFNNRLTVILGNLELLERKLRDDFAASALLKAALSATIGAAELTRRLLTFSRQQVLESSLININELVAGMYDMLQRSLGETINIVMSPGQNLWLVMTDRHMLENVLLNLAVNARDAMPAGGQLTIETSNIALDETYVETHVYAVSGGHVLLAVSDTGLGMSEEVKRHAFEPFFTTKGEGKGTGLGLSMVYGFVKQSGGHVEIYSEPGHGTSFKIYLPRAGSAADVASETPARDTGDEDAAMHGKTILLVEDDETVREIVVMLLTDMGCRVLIADSGPAALELFMSHPEIDLLFTDMQMPGGMTGMDLAARLRERLPELRVLYTSGYAPQAAADRRTIEHPNDFWLAKPYRRRALWDAVRHALGEKA